LQRVGNAFVRTVLHSPAHGLLSKQLLVLTVVGRSTGRRYRIPVAYLETDGVLLIGAGVGVWSRNLSDGAVIGLRHRGRERTASVRVLRTEDELAQRYPPLLVANRVHAKFVGIRVEPDGSANRDDLRRAIARGTVLLCLTLEP
jgi:hypothetical protein